MMHSHAERGNDRLLQCDRFQPGRGLCVHPSFCSAAPDAFPAKAGPTKSAAYIL